MVIPWPKEIAQFFQRINAQKATQGYKEWKEQDLKDEINDMNTEDFIVSLGNQLEEEEEPSGEEEQTEESKWSIYDKDPGQVDRDGPLDSFSEAQYNTGRFQSLYKRLVHRAYHSTTPFTIKEYMTQQETWSGYPISDREELEKIFSQITKESELVMAAFEMLETQGGIRRVQSQSPQELRPGKMFDVQYVKSRTLSYDIARQLEYRVGMYSWYNEQGQIEEAPKPWFFRLSSERAARNAKWRPEETVSRWTKGGNSEQVEWSMYEELSLIHISEPTRRS